MIYCPKLEKGIKKKGIPPPRIIDLDVCSTYDEVLKQTKQIFFPDSTNDNSYFSLAGTSGLPFEVEENWSLGDFLKSHGFQPSKLRLYILSKVSIHNSVLIHVLIWSIPIIITNKAPESEVESTPSVVTQLTARPRPRLAPPLTTKPLHPSKLIKI